jgi:hypothetical protein
VSAACLAAGIVLGGCATKPPAGPNPATVQTGEFEAIFVAAREVLRKRYFEEDRVDRRAGVITTLPSTAGGLAEFWRRDSADAEGRALAGLCAVRKTATVQIEKTEPSGYTVAVTVIQERRQLPTVEPTTSSELYSLYRPFRLQWQEAAAFEEASVAEREQQLERRGAAWWADLGRDTALEQALLSDILNRLPTPTAP